MFRDTEKIRETIEHYLDVMPFEELLEELDLSPEEVLFLLWENGIIKFPEWEPV